MKLRFLVLEAGEVLAFQLVKVEFYAKGYSGQKYLVVIPMKVNQEHSKIEIYLDIIHILS